MSDLRNKAGAKRGRHRNGGKSTPRRDRSSTDSRSSSHQSLAVLAAFLAMALLLYRPCFDGPLISDDIFAVLNPYVTPLTVHSVVDVFSPYGSTATMQSEYRPVWFLLHGIERELFGDPQHGYAAYHITNVILHGIVSTLLVVMFRRSGLTLPLAVLGGTIFLVHPANVEAVAWISQLTSTASLGLALSALLLRARHPLVALLCYAVGVLTKPLAAFVLPVAALFTWLERGHEPHRDARWKWLGGWTLTVLAFAVIESIAARDKQFGVPPIHPDPLVVGRTIVGNFLRYLVMAATGYGLAPFQQARPALSWFNPWWLGGTVAIALLVWRAVHCLRHRREEGIYWAWTLVAFAPVSQIVPLIYPVADRYLYFMLPGLVGGTLLAVQNALELVAGRARRATAVRLAGAVAVSLLVLFTIQAYRRAALWVSFEELARDSMRSYPDGIWAHLLRSRAAAQEGDGERSAAELRAAFELGNRDYSTILADPVFRRVASQPPFQNVLAEMADWWITRVNALDSPNQLQLYQLGHAYWLRGNPVEAERAFGRALTVHGPMTEQIRQDLAYLQSHRALQN